MRGARHYIPGVVERFTGRGSPLCLMGLLMCTSPAQAHVGSGTANGFASGFVHPLSGLDHVVAMVSVGLWGAQLGRPAIWALPVTFPLVMAVGGFLGLLGVDLPAVETGIAVSAVLLGLAVLFEARPPLALAAVLVGVFAVFHGYAHGTELPPGEDGALYSIGFVVATGLLHAFGISVGLIYRWRWGQLLLRITGGLVLVVGCCFLWQALA